MRELYQNYPDRMRANVRTVFYTVCVCLAITLLAANLCAQTEDHSSAKPAANEPVIPANPDARIIVNVPAYRLDLYQGDSLIKSYPITIGSPDYSSPYGVWREAVEIVWNPRWAPPNSDWARGEKPAAPGAADNPLGKLKLRMANFPFLIHGGGDKSINRAVSHGCVRLRNSDALELARLLMNACHMTVNDKTIAGYIADRYHEHGLTIKGSVVVEFRYDTITVENNQVHIYPDIYHEGTNNVDTLIYVLYQAGIKYQSLSESDRDALIKALQQKGKQQKLVQIPILTQAQVTR